MKIRHNKKLITLLLIFGLNIFLVSGALATTRMAAFGTNKYDGDDDLPGCDNDARDVYIQMDKKGLIELSGSDSRFGRVTKRLFKDSVERVGETLKEGDTLIIYNSSHGTKSGKICTSDGYISSDELASWIAKSKCSNVLIINDSCFSGGFRVSVPGKRIVQINSANPARVSYTSMIESRLTGRINGVFSKFFLESLDPANSDKDGDGNVTALEILQYVNYGMFVKEHKEIEKFLKDDYAEHYNLSIQKLEEKIQEATNNYNWSTVEADKKHHEEWKDWWEFVRDVKLGKEGMRWQSPTLKGDKNFIVVGKRKDDELPDVAGNYYRCLKKCCEKDKGIWLTPEQSRQKRAAAKGTSFEDFNKGCFYSNPPVLVPDMKGYPDKRGCHFDECSAHKGDSYYLAEKDKCTRDCGEKAEKDFIKHQSIMMERKYGR